MARRIYLAYGSNMNMAQMAQRCPDAKVLGTARLLGWRLLFRGAKDCAFATIEPHRGSTVPVLLWEISPNDERRLDRYEGWPMHYFKQDLTVTLGGKETSAMAYIMTEGRPLGLPCPWYLATIREGYKDCRLSFATLKKALDDSQEE